MEALAVVSLVSNILQLLDVATRSAKKCHQIYKLGSPIDDLHLASLSDELNQCYTTLENSLQVRVPKSQTS